MNFNGHVLIDEYYKPKMPIVNFLTKVSGITPYNLRNASNFVDDAKERVLKLFKGRIIVGHSLSNDFKALDFNEAEYQRRDIA